MFVTLKSLFILFEEAKPIYSAQNSTFWLRMTENRCYSQQNPNKNMPVHFKIRNPLI